MGQRRTTNTQRKNRIAENINVFDFKLSAEEIAAIDGLDTGRRGGPEPDAITLETFGREIRKPESRRQSGWLAEDLLLAPLEVGVADGPAVAQVCERGDEITAVTPVRHGR